MDHLFDLNMSNFTSFTREHVSNSQIYNTTHEYAVCILLRISILEITISLSAYP